MHPKQLQNQKIRQTATYIFLVIGFILFVVFGGKAVQSIRDPKFVEGKRLQVPDGNIAVISAPQNDQILQVASVLESQPNNEPVVSAASEQPNNTDKQLTPEPNAQTKQNEKVHQDQPSKEANPSKPKLAERVL